MTIVSEYIDLKISMKNIEWLNSKGYFGELKEVIKIYWEDLPPFSKKEIDFKCDYCFVEYKRKYSIYMNSKINSKINKDACTKCRGLKTKESNLLMYGVENVMQVEEHKNALRNTNLEKYGVPHALQNEIIKNKVKNTNLKRYGGNAPISCSEVKEKIKATSLKKYGVSNYLETKEAKERIKKTNLEKYGYENPSQSPIIRQKINNSFIKNSTMTTSKQQLHIHTLVGGELNFQISKCFLDIAFPEDKIYLEYDGGGHNLSVKLGNVSQEEFDKKERNRYFLLKDYGYKEIRILCDSDKLIEDNYIVKFIEDAKHLLKNSEVSSVRLDMDKMKYSISYKEWIEYDMKGGLLQLAH